MKTKKSVEVALDNFLALPRIAQLIVFNDLESSDFTDKKNPYWKYQVTGFYTGDCRSPIEEIISFVSCVYGAEHNYTVELQSQIEVICGGKKYYADFMVYDYVADDYLPIIIECDGHEYHHANKAQVKRDNERDMNLKLHGYEVLHFSGSQIYEDPIKCVKEIYQFIKNYQERTHE